MWTVLHTDNAAHVKRAWQACLGVNWTTQWLFWNKKCQMEEEGSAYCLPRELYALGLKIFSLAGWIVNCLVSAHHLRRIVGGYNTSQHTASPNSLEPANPPLNSLRASWRDAVAGVLSADTKLSVMTLQTRHFGSYSSLCCRLIYKSCIKGEVDWPARVNMSTF